MFRRRKDRGLSRSASAPARSGDASPLVEDTISTALQLQSLGERIDSFRRKGGAALGGEPGPEVEVLRIQQDEVMRGFLERALQEETETLEDVHRRLGEMYSETHDLVTGRALQLVEAALRRQRTSFPRYPCRETPWHHRRTMETSSERPVQRTRWRGALIGLVVGGVALGVAHLVAGLANPDASPMLAVGEAAIDASPQWLKSWAIRTFGASDKTVLLVGIGVALAAIAVVLGIASVRRRWVGPAGLVALGAVGVVAALSRPDAVPGDAIPTIAGVAAGALVLGMLRRRASLDEPPSAGQVPGAFDRRRFLLATGAGAVVAVAAGGVGTVVGRRGRASASRAEVAIPRPASPADPPGPALDLAGLDPFFTPNDRFYRVDTTLFVPAVEAEGWELRVHGMVERELTLDFRRLLARPLIERDITLACVSNPVGGPYVGNARWIGAPLGDLLAEAGVRSGADQLVSRSVDGFTAGTPTEVVMDGRDAMLAVAMNGEPLPLEHGFPVRMIVPGLYGYVSATKWLAELELTTFDAYDAYWIQRGWAERAPVKTMSRIDTPRGERALSAGRVPIAGVAWAQHRGIERVEVRVDDGEWLEASLSDAGTIDTWRQWVVEWDATAGEHRLQLRATDGDGVTQPEARAEPFPSGATGWHTVVVRVA